MRSTVVALLAAGLLACPGCATLLAGGPSMVDVDVEGPAQGVELLVKGTGTSDVQHAEGRHVRLMLDRRSSYAVLASAEGYKAEIGRVRTRVNPAVYLDFVPTLLTLFAGNLAGGTQIAASLPLLSIAAYLVDVLTHADQQHEVNAVTLKLVPEATP